MLLSISYGNSRTSERGLICILPTGRISLLVYVRVGGDCPLVTSLIQVESKERRLDIAPIVIHTPYYLILPFMCRC